MSLPAELKPMELLRTELPNLEAILALNAESGTDVKTLALQELEHLRMAGLSKPDIMECMPSTIVMAVKRILKQNLTLDPYAGLVYIKTRNVKVNNEWKKALEIMESCNGLLSIAYQCGKIKDHERPAVTKDTAGKVVGVSFRIQHASGRWEEFTYDESDFYRWQRASHKENGRNKQDADAAKMNYANENYSNWKGGIDPEFARAKAIRHSLKKLGTNPNEGKFSRIIIPAEKQVIIEENKDEEFTHAEAINESAQHRSADDLPL